MRKYQGGKRMFKRTQMIKMIIYGIKNHPGNVLYLFFLIICLLPGISKQSIDILVFGIIGYLVLFVPLYLFTSYTIGKANMKISGRKK